MRPVVLKRDGSVVEINMAMIERAVLEVAKTLALTEDHYLMLEQRIAFPCLRPEFFLMVAIKSEARENYLPSYSKLKTHYKEQSGIFKSTALMWSTLCHHCAWMRSFNYRSFADGK